MRTLAPLRRIVSRSLEVYEYDRIFKELPLLFAVHDELECGHVSSCLTWSALDLLNAYSGNPTVSAKHHRCRPCAELLAHRKPCQSAKIDAVEKIAA